MQFTLLLSLVLSSLSLISAAPISSAEIAENAGKGLRLLSLNEDAEPVWKSEDQVLDLMRSGVKFASLNLSCTFGYCSCIPSAVRCDRGLRRGGEAQGCRAQVQGPCSRSL